MPGYPPVAPAPAPVPSLWDQLRAQIEFYFSEENLNRDFFLRRQMSPEGYVPLILLSGFARVRSLTPMDDGGYGIIGMLGEALSTSAFLELDPSRTKVRRRKNWQRFILNESSEGSKDSPSKDLPPSSTA